MSKRGGLGRGLSALIPGAPEGGEVGTGLLEVPVNAIAPNPKQPRTHFDDEAIASLAASIREVGILQPIVVRRTGDSRFELIAGERRLRAAKAAGLATVPVVLRDSDDADLLREALIENIHREDLNPIEQAEAFKALLGELGLKQEELADRVGVSRSHIANTIRLLGPAARGAAAPGRRQDHRRARPRAAGARRPGGDDLARPAGRRGGPVGPPDRGGRPPVRRRAAPATERKAAAAVDGPGRRDHGGGRGDPLRAARDPRLRSRWVPSAARS